MKKTNAAFMSGVPELVILRLLSQREMYGYELVRSIRMVSQESIDLAEGVIYPSLHSLEQRGMLRSQKQTVEGRSRVYYRTTAAGKKRLRTLHQDWQRVSSGIEAVMGHGRAPACQK